MNDASMTVAAFAGQVKFETAVVGIGAVVTGEGHALVDQPLDRFATVFYRETHGVFMAQAATGIEGVFDMGLHGIGIVEYRGHATLGPEGRAVGQVALAQYGNAQVAGKAQGQAEAGRAAANHKYIMLILLAHFRIPRKATLQACLSGSAP
ncbi:hypothetical protein D3C80_1110630 [compost metagenome]